MTTATRTTEGRLFPALELREVETTADYSMLHGLAVPYREWASIGWFMEEFGVGSLGKSIKEAARALPLNLFHDNRSFPIGSASEWDEREGGLWGTWKLTDDLEAQRAAKAAEGGHLTGLSIEFAPIRSEWKEAQVWDPAAGPDFMDKVTRVEARLGAVGLVQTPAYVSAGVELVRSADARLRAEAAVARGGSATPTLDAMKRVTEQLRAGRA